MCKSCKVQLQLYFYPFSNHFNGLLIKIKKPVLLFNEIFLQKFIRNFLLSCGEPYITGYHQQRSGMRRRWTPEWSFQGGSCITETKWDPEPSPEEHHTISLLTWTFYLFSHTKKFSYKLNLKLFYMSSLWGKMQQEYVKNPKTHFIIKNFLNLSCVNRCNLLSEV